MKKPLDTIDIEFEVSEQKKNSTYVSGAAKDMTIGGRDSGNVFIFCLNDDLRRSIAAQVAERLGRKCVVVNRSDGNPMIEKVIAEDNQIVSLPRAAAKSEKTRRILQDNGKVICILSDFLSLLRATDGSEDAREQISIMLNRFEPSFLEAAHHVVRSDQSEEEILQDTLLKISI
ncbi:hypothetical protein [Maridesulfovibrio sp.]|uniref:hypothetical protein n=1 Tax=Maridesulfovibrio sp. TaxID=2795000 RepID=UPI002A18B567|nr:hypothetical protein [Maridesulfovibrio sp.]